MTSTDAIRALVDVLNVEGIPFMVTGSLASGVYGFPRPSNDADFVLELQQRDPGCIVRHLGPEFVLDDQMSFESITGSMRWILQVPAIDFDIELFLLNRDEHHQVRFQRRQKVIHPTLNCEVYLPTAEDVIIQKVRWGRDKDRMHVRDIIAVQGDALDWPYIQSWCARHGTRALLDELRATVPAI